MGFVNFSNGGDTCIITWGFLLFGGAARGFVLLAVDGPHCVYVSVVQMDLRPLCAEYFHRLNVSKTVFRIL